ncbi:nitroreductase family protein [candidate division KSB1 bacterium]|nr:nitroreductase family protein [candidate division KSB1 bacterium]
MNRTGYIFFILANIIISISTCLIAGELETIKLNEPDKKRGLPFMETLSVKASAEEWSEKELSLQDLSDLCWAATGINRPDEKKTTASSALNAQDVDLYLFMKDGVYLYDIANHELDPVLSGDYRSQIMRPRPPKPTGAPGIPPTTPPPPSPMPSNPPIQIILISDADRFRMGLPELRYEWGALDAGIVSQKISLFCAATGLKTRPRASMYKEKIKTLLKLKDTQHIFLNHPIGYEK